MNEARSNLKVAIRTLARSRGFAAVAILSLGLAIALNTTVYSLLDALLNPRIEVRHPEQLYHIRYYGNVRHSLSPSAVESAMQSGIPGVEGITGFNVRGEATVETATHESVSSALFVRPNFFTVLGKSAVDGRTILPTDAGAQVAVVSARFAASMFASGENPVGARVSVEGTQYQIVGVVESTTLLRELDTDLWLLTPTAMTDVPPLTLRLRAGSDSNTVSRQLAVVAGRLALAAGESPNDTRLYIWGVQQRQFRLTSFHWALIGAAIAVLLVACGNLANLQLARGLSRTPELALRAALGATRADIMKTLMIESGLLALLGLVVGLLLSLWSTAVLHATIPTRIADFFVAPSVSWRMAVAAAVAALVSLVIAGAIPAWRISAVDPASMIKSRAGTGAHRRNRRRYATMIVAQIALALPVLCAAVLLARSALRLERASFIIGEYTGFDPRPVLSANVRMRFAPNAKLPAVSAAAELLQRARGIRAIVDAAVTTSAPPVNKTITIQNLVGMSQEIPAPMWSPVLVSPSYLRTLGRELAAGSDFADGVHERGEVVIDEPTAHFLWPHADAVGRFIKFGDMQSTAPWMRIVGVVHDERDTVAIRATDPYTGMHLGSVYRVMTTSDTIATGPDGVMSVTLYARAKGDADARVVGLRRALASLPNASPPDTRTLEDRMGLVRNRTRYRFVSFVFALFATLSVSLAAIGVYGVVAHSVNERRREFGVRISLGATPRHVLRDVLGEGTILALLGVAIGLFLTQRTSRWLAWFLSDQNDAYDATLFALVSLALVAATVAAALSPALRATRIDPVEALRNL